MEWLAAAVGFLGVLVGVGIAAVATQAAFAGLERAARRRRAAAVDAARSRRI